MTPVNTLPYDQLLEVRRTGVCPMCFVPVSPQGVGAHARGKLHQEAMHRRALEARGYAAVNRHAYVEMLQGSPASVYGETSAPGGLVRFLRACGLPVPEIGADAYVPAVFVASRGWLPEDDWARVEKRLKAIARKAQHDQDEILRAADVAIRLGATLFDALGVKP